MSALRRTSRRLRATGGLVAFANRDDLPALVQAALAHARFESIHPFTDGNGRIGRALINAVLRRRGATTRIVLPLASALVTDREGYFDVLTAYRGGEVRPLLASIAESSRIAAAESRITAARLKEIPDDWRMMLGAVRRGSAVAGLLDLLPSRPIISSEDAGTGWEPLRLELPAAAEGDTAELWKGGAVRRNAIMFHGTGGNPEVCWFPWLRRRLTERGYTVDVPHYPGLNVEPIDTFLPKVLAEHTFDQHTVLVGHSGGAALLLAVLQHIDATVNQAVLVAGYATQPNTSEEPVLQVGYDWAAIKAHARDLYFINSRNDPYGCHDGQGRALFERLGGTQIVRDDGHFGDHAQPYETFELLDRLID